SRASRLCRSLPMEPQSMSAEELQAEIEATRRRAEAEEARLPELEGEIDQAWERQRLRGELHAMQRRLGLAEDRNDVAIQVRGFIDNDEVQSHLLPSRPEQPVMHASGGGSAKFDDMVAKGEYVWRIEGFSWVPCALKQKVVAYWDPPYVDARDGQFVQWGETRDVVHCRDRCAYGPDVHWPGHPPSSLGIFGLSHEELLQSEWVQNDTLTVKFEIEVRPAKRETWQPLSLAAEIPEPTMLDDTQALLEEGTCSDVQIVAQGEVIQAHSQVLCARSEVFRKQLTAGMQESVSKVIVIEDCDVAAFKAFLRFLYTDRFPEVKDFVAAASSSNDEAKLSEQVDIAQVCGILCQAHLLQAKQLEKACLSFIRDHATQVLTLPTYADMVKKWPQIGLKVSLFLAGKSDTELSAAMAGLDKPRGQESEQEQANSEGALRLLSRWEEAEALRAAIEDERRRAEAEEARLPELVAETEQAKEQQRLREELRAMIGRREDAEQRNAEEIEFREAIASDALVRRVFLPRKQGAKQASGGESTNFRNRVSTVEHVWRIEGFSWVPDALEQHDWPFDFTHSSFDLGNRTFQVRYSPWAGYLCDRRKGSLALALHRDEECIALRYRIYVKARSGAFVQWGEMQHVIHDGRRGRWSAYGPDVHWPDDPPASLGIFGLSHEELLQSEWIQDDTLTVKFELEVRPDRYATRQGLSLAAEIPEPTIIEDTRALLEEGTCSDVRFMVQDEVIPAHSQVLCARSEVFRKQLTGGMQESVSKVIVIEDCDVATFRDFLRFLYTDRFPEVKDFGAAATSSNDEAEHDSPKVSPVQSLLRVSNKYQVTRLQLWCEAKLSEQVDTAQVCGILCQAHLLQAEQLEKACLSFIKDHATQVLTLPAYADMVKKWPQIGLKVSLLLAGKSDTELSAAMAGLDKPRGQESEQAPTELFHSPGPWAFPARSDSSLKGPGELRAAIEEERRWAEAEEARLPELLAKTEQAKERQRLREELKDMILRRRDAEVRNSEETEFREGIDDDEIWANPPLADPARRPCVMQARDRETVNFRDKICTGEHLWRIEGFSWVPCTLEQCRAAYGSGAHFVHSRFELGRQTFLFCYSPWADMLCYQHHGSLAIVLHTEDCIALRYRIYVKAQSGEFVQWGQTRDVVHDGESGRTCAYGPDVHWPGEPPTSLGIFGLSHEELLQSEWVQNDTLTVKFELEVRPPSFERRQRVSTSVDIPEPSIHQDTQALLEEGTCSDVRFMVQDEVLRAHSQVLCARSEVFRKQLTGGMQESVSNVIKIEDCDVATFKAFLQFLYTDRLPDVQDFIPATTSSSRQTESSSPKLSLVQALLAVSHKYQVTRLQLWCEAKLSEQVDTAQVCDILCQAHLLQAKQLEKACLSFIRDHATQVHTLPAYADMVKKWPQIGLKVSLFSAGVSDTELSAAMAGLEKPRGQELEQEEAGSGSLP
ncbi:BPM2, partial [Symbiodinium necroappetens]